LFLVSLKTIGDFKKSGVLSLLLIAMLVSIRPSFAHETVRIHLRHYQKLSIR
jgi:hypothetical protein